MDINLRVIARSDPDIVQIVDTVSHIAVYSFEESTQSWSKLGVEGPLFIYSRSSAPAYRWMILNRLALNNPVGDLTSDLRLLRSESLLIFKDPSQVIGLWFYSDKELERTFQFWQSIVDQDRAGQPRRAVANGVSAKPSLPSGRKASSQDNALVFLFKKAMQDHDHGRAHTQSSSSSSSAAHPSLDALLFMIDTWIRESNDRLSLFDALTVHLKDSAFGCWLKERKSYLDQQ